MTTIATDGKTVAADGMETWGAEAIRLDVQKIKRGKDCIYGFTGTGAMFAPIIDWYEKGAHVGTMPEVKGDNTWGFLIIRTSGVTYYTNTCPYPAEYPFPLAVGSGCDYATGAMLHGASPREAVEIAASRNIHTGGTITVLSLDEIELREAAE